MAMVLLDRDGVLNVDRKGSVTHPDQLILLPGVADAVARLNRAGIKVVVVTNQAGVGRGEIDRPGLDRIHAKLEDELGRSGAWLDDLIVCADPPDSGSLRRKPNPGMLLEALSRHGEMAEETPMIGDDLRDLEAATAAGCARVLVKTGKGRETLANGLPDHVKPVAVYENLAAAVDSLVGEGKRS